MPTRWPRRRRAVDGVAPTGGVILGSYTGLAVSAVNVAVC